MKPEYHGLPGPEIGKLAKEGVNIHDIVHTPEIAYTGTTRNIFPDYSRATAQDPPIRYFNYRSQEKGNVFRGVCESFRSRIGGARGGRHPPPDGDPLSCYQHLVAATAAVGMHPTGMHSCS